MTTYYIPTQSLPVLLACHAFTKAKNTVELSSTPISQEAYNANYRHPETVRWSPNYQPRVGDVFIYMLHDDCIMKSSYISARVTECALDSYDEEL